MSGSSDKVPPAGRPSSCRPGKLVVKGVHTVDDAKAITDLGADIPGHVTHLEHLVPRTLRPVCV